MASAARTAMQVAQIRSAAELFSDLRAPGYDNWDMSIQKYFPIQERVGLQLGPWRQRKRKYSVISQFHRQKGLKLKIALHSVSIVRGYPYPIGILLNLHQPGVR